MDFPQTEYLPLSPPDLLLYPRGMKTRILTLISTIIFLAPYCLAEQVCSVHDGDTLRLCNGQRIRLWGIDAPELIQPMGINARDYLQTLTMRKEVRLDCRGKSYKRSVCMVAVDTATGSYDVAREMVSQGWAYDSVKYSHGTYGRQEAMAKGLKRGVWTLPDGGVRPWDWRQERRKITPLAPQPST